MNTVKLPGGGVEFGEGLREALQREFVEEAGIAVQVTQHLYTSDIYTQSAFDPEAQVIGVYYLVEAEEAALEQLRENCTQSVPGSEMHLVLQPIATLSAEDFTFEIDRLAVTAFLQAVNREQISS